MGLDDEYMEVIRGLECVYYIIGCVLIFFIEKGDARGGCAAGVFGKNASVFK